MKYKIVFSAKGVLLSAFLVAACCVSEGQIGTGRAPRNKCLYGPLAFERPNHQVFLSFDTVYCVLSDNNLPLRVVQLPNYSVIVYDDLGYVYVAINPGEGRDWIREFKFGVK